MEKKRIEWLDVAKFIGIFAIYQGHFTAVAGKSHDFVFQFHVPLFFLISGCAENFNKETELLKNIKKKFENILIPTAFFVLISVVMEVILKNAGPSDYKLIFSQVAKGIIRNQFFAGSLWFLTCLFVVEIIFEILKKIKDRRIVFVVCLLMFVISEKVMNPRPIVNPSWPYNIDSAFYYIIFYAIGFFVFPVLNKLFELKTKQSRIIVAVSGALTCIYSILVYERKYILLCLSEIPFVNIFIPVIRALLMIYCCLVIARIFENVTIFKEIGKNTLYLCGSEWIIKTCMITLFQIIGMNINVTTPFATYIYTIVLLGITYKYLVPLEKMMLRKR